MLHKPKLKRSIACAAVLRASRPVVKSFTGTLKAKVTAASTRRQAAGRLHYLDFGERLLAPGGDALHPELQFDGTHMAPCYVKHLDAALSGVA